MIYIVFNIGIENICRLLKCCEDKKDCWLIYEVCKGQTMNEGMFNVKENSTRERESTWCIIPCSITRSEIIIN